MNIEYCGAANEQELRAVIICAMKHKKTLQLEQTGRVYTLPNNFFDGISGIKIIGRNNVFVCDPEILKGKDIVLEGIEIK